MILIAVQSQTRQRCVKRYGVPRIMTAGLILCWCAWSWRFQAGCIDTCKEFCDQVGFGEIAPSVNSLCHTWF
jgi:hypothetical protein